MIKSTIFIGLVFFASYTFAQEPRHYNFSHYTAESGLMSYQMGTSLQDEDGYIWISTNEGLQRFDGIRFKNFQHRDNDPSSLPSKSIRQIIKDKKRNLWVLTMDGKAGIFNTNTFSFSPVAIKVKNEAQLYAPPVYKQLITDEYGNIFLLIKGQELITYNEEKKEFSAAYNFIQQQPGWSITDLVQQPGTQKYWMCIKGKGLAVYNRAGNVLSYAGNNVENEKLIELYGGLPNVENIFFDKRGRCWFAEMETGFSNAYCYNLITQQPEITKYRFEKIQPGFHQLNIFFEQRDGTIWISGVNLFARYLEKEKIFEPVFNGYVDDRSIDFVVIEDLFEDRERNIWVGTGNNGLFRFNPSEEFFSNIKHINPTTGREGIGAPVSFMDETDGSILTGVWNEGLFRYDKNLKSIPLDIKGFPDKIPPTITGMSRSADGKYIWMAAFEGFYRYDTRRREVKYYSSPLLKSRIREIEEDSKGNLWLGTQEHGLFKWNIELGSVHFESGLTNIAAIPPIKINKILIDKKGYIWLGTVAEGAYVLDPETEKTIMHFHVKAAGDKKLPEQTVSSILEYNDSLVVISTNISILVYNRLQQKIATLGNGEKTAGYISSMERDKSGYLWVSTNTSLFRVNIESKVFLRFNRIDGIRNDCFILSASHVLPDGRIVLGATATMVVFDPAHVNVNLAVPNCHITDFKIMNQSVRLDSILQQKEIELGPDYNSISIDLSTLTFTSPYIIKYKLAGLDKEWRTADKTQQLVYSYLPPGTYTLMVYTMDDKGKKGDMPLQLAIRVAPVFWKTWWFLGLAILVIGFLLFWFDRERMKRKEAIHKMRSDIAGNLHEQLSSALGNINVLSEMARLKADKEPQKSKEFIEQIHTRSNNMINSMNDMLWNIDPENDSMHKALERIREHAEALSNRYGVQIDLLVDKDVEALKLDMKQRQDIFWFLKSGITNMVRAGAANCRVHIRLEKSAMLYTIEFDNTNADQQQLSNILQRQELDTRLKTANATLNVQTHKTKTIIDLRIPLGS